MTKTFYDELMVQKQTSVRTSAPAIKNSFLNALENEMNNVTTTENGAKTYAGTSNASLDLFGKIAACRKDPSMAVNLFRKSYAEDMETALRILFWARDIRGGQGERLVFRTILTDLAKKDTSVVEKIVPLIPFYGRWDDLMVLENTDVWTSALNLIKEQLTYDLNQSVDSNVSLLAKWLPSINASSQNSKRLGRKIAEHMGWKESFYRKALAILRKKIAIVERDMCAKQWENIDYEKVPSRAQKMYRKAFGRNDAIRYNSFLTAVEKGEAKINAGTLYPSDIVSNYLNQYFSWYYGNISINVDRTLEAQWKALPNYMEGKTFNGLVVADTSGSMRGEPIAVAVALAMYIAERNESPVWKNKFITFSKQPTLQSVVGKTVAERVSNLIKAHWDMNTDLMAVFKMILNTATANNVPADQMPSTLIIVSDMQFDQACRSNKRTNFEQIQKLYRKAGYEMPQVIFWNVRASTGTPVTSHESGTALISGYSPSSMGALLSGKDLSPVGLMNDVVYADRYALVGKALA